MARKPLAMETQTMSQIKSKIVRISQSDEHIFHFISDFTNFEKLMPPQVQNLTITKDNCSFTLQGLPPINLIISDRVPFSLVKMDAYDGKLPFSLSCSLQKIDEVSCEAQFIFDAELNMMMKMMVEKPLTNFLNILIERLKNIN